MRDAAYRLRMLMLGRILAASDVPSGRAVLFGAIAVALAAVVIGALWKGFAYGVGAAIGKALRKELGKEFSAIGDQFTTIAKQIDHLHDCVERRLGVVEARESSALVTEVKRMADAVARTAYPARKTDPPGTDYLAERALPPSET